MKLRCPVCQIEIRPCEEELGTTLRCVCGAEVRAPGPEVLAEWRSRMVYRIATGAGVVSLTSLALLWMSKPFGHCGQPTNWAIPVLLAIPLGSLLDLALVIPLWRRRVRRLWFPFVLGSIPWVLCFALYVWDRLFV